MTNEQKALCGRIAEYYGPESQEWQTVSELSELMHVLTRRKDQRKQDWQEMLIDEIADVSIMLHQMINLNNISDDELRDRITAKLLRQFKRILEAEERR